MHQQPYAMNCILMDIKKFLKKLETGQLEIEAGQWELHKDITNLKVAIQDFKQLKTDMELMKQCGVKQTDLIKELEFKITALEQMHASDRWSTTSSSSKEELANDDYDDCKSENEDQCYQIKKKNKSHRLTDDEVLGIRSRDQKLQVDSLMEFKPKTEIFAPRKNGQPFRRIQTRNTSPKSPRTRDHGILQRYLQDSAKYIERDKSHMSYGSCKPHLNQKRKSETVKSKIGQQKPKKRRNSTKIKKATIPKNVGRPGSPKKLACKTDFLSQNKAKPLYYCKVCKKYFVCKNHLRKHGMIRGKNFKGFKCSYCHKICKSPDKLTAHLKNCRIITKTEIGKKRG